MCIYVRAVSWELSEKVAFFEVSLEIDMRFVSPCFEGYLGDSLPKNTVSTKGLVTQ